MSVARRRARERSTRLATEATAFEYLRPPTVEMGARAAAGDERRISAVARDAPHRALRVAHAIGDRSLGGAALQDLAYRPLGLGLRAQAAQIDFFENRSKRRQQ